MPSVDRDAPPLGLQIVGSHGEDQQFLKIAAAIDAAVANPRQPIALR
jgi:Asp-tRNA(Asn)/Glu-tRNA(Gln) amidotransferase A subunit family amidase